MADAIIEKDSYSDTGLDIVTTGRVIKVLEDGKYYINTGIDELNASVTIQSYITSGNLKELKANTSSFVNGSGRPTDIADAYPGMTYFDASTGVLYICQKVENGRATWREAGSGGASVERPQSPGSFTDLELELTLI